MAQRRSNESGQSIVIMAFAIVVLMGILAVAIDGGRIYTLRRDAQNAADAAALQGARSLCRDEDFIAVAEDVADRGGFSGAGVVEVNNPPLYSDSVVNDDQVEVVITATINGGLIAPIVYDGQLTTKVHAIGDCLRGTLSGSGSAIFAGATGCPGNEVSIAGASVNIIGGVHSNGQVQIGGGGQNSTITGTVSHVGGTNLPNQNTTLVPPEGNPSQVTTQAYPLDLEYADFRPGGWAYDIITTTVPLDYHYFPQGTPANQPVDRGDLEARGLITGSTLARGVYVAPTGFKFSGGLIGDGVTFVAGKYGSSTWGTIDFSGPGTMMRPYFSGLLLLADGTGNPCASAAVINMSGAQVSWGGIIYAPNGNVNMSFSDNSTFFGSIIAGTVNIGGANTTIIYDPSYLPPDPDTIELGT